MFEANGVEKILKTTDVSQWNLVSGVNNPGKIETWAMNVDELKKSDSLCGLVYLKQPDIWWSEQLTLTFASNKRNKQMAFISTTEEKKAIFQMEQFSVFNLPVNTMAYVKRALAKRNQQKRKLESRNKKMQKLKSFKFPQQEQFANEIKSLKVEKEIPKISRNSQSSTFIDKKGFNIAKGSIGKSQLDITLKRPILSYWKHHVVEPFLRNDRKEINHERFEHVINIFQQRFSISGLRNALLSIKNKCITCKKREHKQTLQRWQSYLKNRIIQQLLQMF